MVAAFPPARFTYFSMVIDELFSNLPPSGQHSDAPRVELLLLAARPEGLEPPTSWSEARRSRPIELGTLVRKERDLNPRAEIALCCLVSNQVR